MTSQERKEQRYLRRKAKRESKKTEYISKYNDISLVYEVNNLYKASIAIQRGIRWKRSTHHYDMNILKHIAMHVKNFNDGIMIKRKDVHFNISERGKIRNISSVNISERAIHKSLVNNVLLPILYRNLIYDNGSSIKNKGITFALNRLSLHLKRYYRANNFSNDGYILLIDLSKYFDSIQHDKVIEMLHKTGLNQQLIDFVMYFIDNGTNKGLTLGSEINQALAIGFANSIDHYIKDKLGIKYYGRYMDDSYIICNNKKQLNEYLRLITIEYNKLGISINTRKTGIFKLKSGFNYLKIRYILTPTGKIIKKPYKKSIIYQLRKMKKFKKFYDNKTMTMDNIYQSYTSWRNNVAKYNAYKIIKCADKLYQKLFVAKENANDR